MVETLKARTRVIFSSVVESIWATGVGVVAGQLSKCINHINFGVIK